MIIITVNAGSTSVRLGAFDLADAEPRELMRERHAARAFDAQRLLREFADRVGIAAPQGVAHRVVHGGTAFAEPCVIDEPAQHRLAALSPLAPLHNPVALAWIDAARAAFGPAAKQIALFDTAFFARLPPAAAQYALPPALGLDLGVRRYGFHGLAHEAMWRQWCALRPDLDGGGRLVTLQLGGGCSIAAIDRGRPIDTSMGFTPLEGLVMATRCGDIDASVIPYLSQRLGEPDQRIIERLNRECGWLGVSGKSADMGALIGDTSHDAQLAVEMFCTRARKYVGAYLALLNGCDGIAFGGGIGENVPAVRARILCGMEWAGITLDEPANANAHRSHACVSARRSRVAVHVMSVDEETILARGARTALV